MVDSEFLKRTLLDLIAINSVNPLLSEDGVGEAEIAAFTVTMMETLGMEAHLDEVAPGRFNAVGIRRGLKADGRKLMFNAHMDTVGINGMARPFQPEIVSGRVFGRGAQDMKGSLAAMLAAVKALNDSGVQLEGDLILAGVADEEWSSLGSQHLVKHYPADAAIVAEPSDLGIATAHRGFIGYEIDTTGRAAHGSRYQDGIDAILLMGAFLHELAGLERELVRREPHPLVGPPSLHTSTIHGGTEMSTYPAACKLMIERRTCPGETVEQATRELQALLERCKENTPNFEGRLTRVIDRPPFELAHGSELLRTTQVALQQRTGRPANPQGVTFWTDAAILAEAGIPSLILGPVGKGLHSAEEWVDLQSCLDLAAVMGEVAQKFCGVVG